MPKPILLLGSGYVARLLDGALDERFDCIAPGDSGDIDGAVALLATHCDAALLDRLPKLRLVVAPGTGYETIDVAAARARGVRVATAGGTHSGDVADHVLALALAAIHRIPEADRFVRDGRWSAGAAMPARRAMAQHRFGVVGFGAIGRAVAARLQPFGGEIAWWSRSASEAPWPRRDSLLDLAQWCTALVVAVRGDAAGLVDAATLDAIGPEGLIVNISRGAVIDEGAMIAALKAGRLGAAALDVFAEEPTPPQRWAGVPNLILTPHAAGVSEQSTVNLRAAAVRNLLSVLDGGPLVHEITA